MKLEKSYTIEGEIVEEEFKNGDITIYSRNVSSDLMYLYFVNTKSDKVLFKQIIEADCNQNSGYIATMYFKDVE